MLQALYIYAIITLIVQIFQPQNLQHPSYIKYFVEIKLISENKMELIDRNDYIVDETTNGMSFTCFTYMASLIFDKISTNDQEYHPARR